MCMKYSNVDVDTRIKSHEEGAGFFCIVDDKEFDSCDSCDNCPIFLADSVIREDTGGKMGIDSFNFLR